ncbi:MAG: hypothetical protein JSR17_05195 [Proteobacteria bacterium]|nr:hypothetical protein [Pseudomonadota bacterium]
MLFAFDKLSLSDKPKTMEEKVLALKKEIQKDHLFSEIFNNKNNPFDVNNIPDFQLEALATAYDLNLHKGTIVNFANKNPSHLIFQELDFRIACSRLSSSETFSKGFGRSKFPCVILLKKSLLSLIHRCYGMRIFNVRTALTDNEQRTIAFYLDKMYQVKTPLQGHEFQILGDLFAKDDQSELAYQFHHQACLFHVSAIESNQFDFYAWSFLQKSFTDGQGIEINEHFAQICEINITRILQGEKPFIEPLEAFSTQALKCTPR